MTYYGFHIPVNILELFETNAKKLKNFTAINKIIKKVCGINKFFSKQSDVDEFYLKLKEHNSIVSEPHRRQYGDYQTNNALASSVVNYVFKKHEKVDFLLEPTCGRGNFIVAAIKKYKTLTKIVGIEIYFPYVIETKFKILNYYLENPQNEYPDIDIVHESVFDFPFAALSKSTINLKTLVVGNPPWVTNSELGSIDSNNLPQKSNFKKLGGFDAITGKGNFDIGESISIIMLKLFHQHEGGFAFLIKNAVVKNIIHDQKCNDFRIGKIEELNIDSKKEFNVSVNASLFYSKLNSTPEYTCRKVDFYNGKLITEFGWLRNKFVNSTSDYKYSNIIDGRSAFIWRSGVKHDCSKIMELEKSEDSFVNKLGEEFKIEENLVYGLLKSSDLKSLKTKKYRKQTIITQRKIGAKTDYIKKEYPLTYKYLNSKKSFFDRRKSSIYKDKPEFSIFGIGQYSFAKYKIAISGLYKTTHFTLVSPSKSKPIMLDDTCYFIGFDNYKTAQIAHFLANSEIVQKFLKSIIFSDAKRAVNKDILMRIDFGKAFACFSYEEALESITNLKINDWEEFGESVNKKQIVQTSLF